MKSKAIDQYLRERLYGLHFRDCDSFDINSVNECDKFKEIIVSNIIQWLGKNYFKR